MWSPLLTRLRAAVNGLAHDHDAQAQAAVVAGQALIADSLPVVRNPITLRRRRLGLFALLLPAVFPLGMVGMADGLRNQRDPYPEGWVVTGTVVAVPPQSSARCEMVVEYTVDAKKYLVTSWWNGVDLCDTYGTSVEVAYMPDAPAEGKIILEGRGIVEGILRWLGLFLLGTIALALTRRIALLISGIRLRYWGLRRLSSEQSAVDSAWMNSLHSAWRRPARPSTTTP